MQIGYDLYDLDEVTETYEPVHWLVAGLIGAILMFGLLA